MVTILELRKNYQKTLQCLRQQRVFRMGAHIIKSTIDGGLTPICNNCGVSLCWDISQLEYEEEKEFWDNWECKDCNPDYKGARKKWKAKNQQNQSSILVGNMAGTL